MTGLIEDGLNPLKTRNLNNILNCDRIHVLTIQKQRCLYETRVYDNIFVLIVTTRFNKLWST